ncbi:MAG: Uma2 family endonuclease [Chloroflexota bacterium]
MTIQTVEPVKTPISPRGVPAVSPQTHSGMQPRPLRPSDNGRHKDAQSRPSKWNGKRAPAIDLLEDYGVETVNEEDINYDDIITEDDEPVDNFPSEKQQRLLVQPLFDNNYLPEPFIAAVDIGIFRTGEDPIVPDMFLSLGVGLAKELWDQENRSYFLWKFGKPPEIAVEIVSNKKGRETTVKLEKYAQYGIKYYVIFDFQKKVQDATLTVYELQEGVYVARSDYQLPDVGLSLDFWDGTFEKMEQKWLRWYKSDGEMLLTGKEDSNLQRALREHERVRAEQAEIHAEQEQARAKQERIRAEQERIRAEQERIRAEQERIRAEQEQAEKEQARIRAEQAEALAAQEQAEKEQERIRAEQAEALAAQAEALAAQERAEKEALLAKLQALGIEI